MNPTNVAYFMVGGPFHGQEITLPHQVATYEPVVDGELERYFQHDVQLFGRKFRVLVHSSHEGDEARTNEAMAHCLLNVPNVYKVWSNAALAFLPTTPPMEAVVGLGETRADTPPVLEPR